jgi:hypothetical protein
MFVAKAKKGRKALQRCALLHSFLVCLIPKKHTAPKAISRYIIIAPPPASPDPNAEGSAQLYQNAARFSYPDELLKHQFLPIGSESPDRITTVDKGEHIADMDVQADGIRKVNKRRKVGDEKLGSPKKSRSNWRSI